MDPTQMQQPTTPAAAPELPAPNPEIVSPLVQKHMAALDQMTSMMDGKIGDAYDRVHEAGLKMLYSPDNSEMMISIIQDESIPIANKLGEGMANLLVMMDNTGNGTIPKEVLVPVGVSLMFEAADYLYEIGVEVTEEDMGAALELLIKGIFVGYGIDPAQMDNIVDQLGEKLGFKEEANEEADAVTGEAEAGESGIEPMDEEAAFQQGFKDDRKQQLGL